jgi:hypothetical protein
MTNAPKLISPQEALVRRAAVLEELAAVYLEIARAQASAPEPVLSGSATFRITGAESVDIDQLVKLPLTDAIVAVLIASKRPQSARQIWDTLARAGRQMEAEDPVRSVQWALKKLLTKNDDVFSTGWGKWHHKSRYTTRKLNKLIASRAGTGGRTHEEHIERTKKGLEKAREKGKLLGARRRTTDEQIVELRRLVEVEKCSILSSCKAVGVSPSLYYYYKREGRFSDGTSAAPSVQSEPANIVQFARS